VLPGSDSLHVTISESDFVPFLDLPQRAARFGTNALADYRSLDSRRPAMAGAASIFVFVFPDPRIRRPCPVLWNLGQAASKTPSPPFPLHRSGLPRTPDPRHALGS
jgi:hypothetical protein